AVLPLPRRRRLGIASAMFEHRHQPLVPTAVFLRRLVLIGVAFTLLIPVSLAIGTAAYHWIAHLPWIDALLNASMILTGMGPVDRLEFSGAKLFGRGYTRVSARAL